MNRKKRRSIITVSIAVVICLLIIAIFAAWSIERLYFKGRNLEQPNTSFSTADVIGVYSAIVTFLGTSILGVVAIWQNQSIRNEIKVTERQKAELEAEPIFVIDLLGTDQRLTNVSLVRSLDNDPRYMWDNFAIRLRNCGNRSVFNVLFCETYIQDAMVSNQSIELYISYDDVFLNNSITEELLSINPIEYPRSDIKYPRLIVVGYSDAYGNNKTQRLKLCKNIEKHFYAKQGFDEKNDFGT